MNRDTVRTHWEFDQAEDGAVRERHRRRPVIATEARLIFSLARAVPVSTTQVSRTDWRGALQLASDENALIALRHAVHRAGKAHVPRDVERQLALLSLDREFRMRRLRERLEQVLIAFNAADIEVLVLKGCALAATVYESFAQRSMRDIDILVRPDRADDARRLMLELGWLTDPELPDDRSYTRHHHLAPLRDPELNGLRLEIHRSVLPPGHPFAFADEEIWRAARSIRVGAGRALAMHPTHQAVHIAIHLAWSHMMRLGAWNAFRDLDALSVANVLDWREFTTVAKQWRASSCCYWTLRLAGALSGLSVPQEIMCELRPALPDFVLRSLTHHFVRALTRAAAACPSVRLNEVLWTLAMQPRLNGHGGARPWQMSGDLVSAFEEKTSAAEGEITASRLMRMRRTGRYIAEIVA